MGLLLSLDNGSSSSSANRPYVIDDAESNVVDSDFRKFTLTSASCKQAPRVF